MSDLSPSRHSEKRGYGHAVLFDNVDFAASKTSREIDLDIGFGSTFSCPRMVAMGELGYECIISDLRKNGYILRGCQTNVFRGHRSSLLRTAVNGFLRKSRLQVPMMSVLMLTDYSPRPHPVGNLNS
jgi:hypothetical protein